MLFVMCFRPEYIWHFKNEKELKEAAINNMIDEYKKKIKDEKA